MPLSLKILTLLLTSFRKPHYLVRYTDVNLQTSVMIKYKTFCYNHSCTKEKWGLRGSKLYRYVFVMCLCLFLFVFWLQLSQFFAVVLMVLVLSLVVLHLTFFCCLRKAVLRDCGIYWLSSNI